MTTSNKSQSQIKKMNMRQLQKYAKSNGMDISAIKRKNELLELIMFTHDQKVETQKENMAILEIAYSSTIETPIVDETPSRSYKADPELDAINASIEDGTYQAEENLEKWIEETPIVEKVETPIVEDSIERSEAIKFLSMITDSPTQDMINAYIDSIKKAKDVARKEKVVTANNASKTRSANKNLKGNRAKCARLLATIVSAPQLFSIFDGDHVVMSSDIGMAHGFTADQCTKYMTDWSHSYGSLGAHFLSFGFRSRGVKRTSTIEFYLLTTEEQKDLCAKMKKEILIEATEESAELQIKKMLKVYDSISSLDENIVNDLSK